jgi:hypothetical protein
LPALLAHFGIRRAFSVIRFLDFSSGLSHFSRPFTDGDAAKQSAGRATTARA